MNPQPRIVVPKAHESSQLRSPRDSDSVNRQWRRHNATHIQESSNTNAIQVLNQKVEKIRRRILGGSGTAFSGWFWTSGQRVFDISQSYNVNQVVYIPPDSALVTIGIDNDGETIFAVPGLWVATQDTDGTTATLPQWPYPVADNPDSSSNYWWLISPAPVCT
jgi:hypothetical protein